MQWQAGNVRISKVEETVSLIPGIGLIPEATREALAELDWLAPHFADAEGNLRLSIHAFVIESQGQSIMVDTCVGNHKNRPGMTDFHQRNGPFLHQLAAAGFPRERIDTVLCTHLHFDHVGWNTMLVDGSWTPTFDHARYLLPAAEWAHWRNTVIDERDAFSLAVADSVQPLFDADLVDLVEQSHQITDEVWLEPTPGHTPGHVSVHIESLGEHAVITGDLMHSPAQCARPHWNSGFDDNPDLAARTRRGFLERYADQPVLILGTHFASPTGGHLVRDGNAYRLDV